MRRCAICRSKSARTKNLESGIAAGEESEPPGPPVPGGLVDVHAADARVTTASMAASAVARLDIEYHLSSPDPR